MSQYKVVVSTELMDNYKQAELIAPQDTFMAVQTEEGLALLFSIGTDGVFYLIEQLSGSSDGFQQIDLSSALAAVHDGAITAKTFAVAQNPSTGAIDLALVVTASDGDYVYLSLGNPDQTGAITADAIDWTPATFDDPALPGIALDVADVFIAEASSSEYIVVDLCQTTFPKPTPYLSRYYLQPGGKQVWNPMTIGGELEDGAMSCLGRVGGDRVDGMYTLGQINGTLELLYAPLYNPYSPTAPVTVRRLTVPAGGSAVACCDSGQGDASTDLFVAGTAGLSLFLSTNQEDGAKPALVVASALFDGASSLYAIAADGMVTVWGLNNRTDQIFYVTCAQDALSDPGAWSVPVPILDGVEQVAPYVNRSNSANTYFAHTGESSLTIGVKSPGTTIWNRRPVSLPPPDTQTKATQFRAYTTRVQVTDEYDQPVAGVPVALSSTSDVSVYINHLYHVLGSTPIQVPTDGTGCVTVIDALTTLSGAQVQVALADGTASTVDPMASPLQRATQLQSAQALRDATITYQDGTTKKLVKDGVSSDTLDAVAQANTQLAQAYAHVSSGGGAQLKRAPVTRAMSAAALGESIWVEAGDLFTWLEHEVAEVGEVLWNEAMAAWTFVVTIAGEVYSAVLDCVEAVAAAVQTVFHAVIEALEDLIDFLKYLFDLDDILRTKQVITNIASLFLQQQVDQIEVFKGAFDSAIASAIQTIDNWAGVGDPSLGEVGDTPSEQSTKPANTTAPGDLVSYHYRGNANNASYDSTLPVPPPPSNPVTVLIDALESEWDVLGDAIEALSALVARANQMTPLQFLEQGIAIVADTVLESAQVVVDALLDILYDLASSALVAFTTPIHIPVVSDILAGFGVPEFSFLDVLAWIGAIPATIGYKLVAQTAPFPDDANTSAIVNASSWSALEALFSVAQPKALAAAATAITLPASVQTTVFLIGHTLTGIIGLLAAAIGGAEAAAETGDNPWSTPSAIVGVLGGGLGGATDFLVPRDPIQNTVVSTFGTITTGVRIVCKLIFSGPGQTFLGGKAALGKLVVEDARGVGAIVDAVLVLPALACTCWHYVELAQNDDMDAAWLESVLGETSAVSAYLSRVSYAIAVNDPDPDTKALAVAGVVLANVLTGGLQIGVAVTGAANP